MKERRKGVQVLTRSSFSPYCRQAGSNDRGRVMLSFHNKSDLVQRMVNFVQPYSYIRPHKHEDPHKTETFLVLNGEIVFFKFSDEGEIIDWYLLGEGHDVVVIDIVAGVWHTYFATQKDSVVFECKEGPYDPETDKKWPTWAPEEGSKEASSYLKTLLEIVGR